MGDSPGTPRSAPSRPSFSTSQSWPRLPAFALTNSTGQFPLDDIPDIENEAYHNDTASVDSSASGDDNHRKKKTPDMGIKQEVNACGEELEINADPQLTDTLVEAAMEHEGIRDRHVKFHDHVLASAVLVQNMLADPGSPATNDTINHFTARLDDEEADVEPNVMTALQPVSSGVLSSLMKLDAQRRRNETEYLKKKDKKHKKKDKDKKKEKKPRRPTLTSSQSTTNLLSSYQTSMTKLSAGSTPSPTATSRPSTQVKRPKLNRPVSWLSTMSTGHDVVPGLTEQRKSNRVAYSRRNSVDSMMTTASQFEPITLDDRIRITFEIANILQKQDFLKKLAKSLMLYGCPAHRLEQIMRHVTTTLRVEAEYIYLPDVMLLSFFDASTHTTETHFIRQSQYFDMDKLTEIYRLEKLVSYGEVSVDEALEFIDCVATKPPLFPIWLNPLIFAICSFSGCVMFFGGRWQDAGVSAALATLFAVYEVISGRFQSFQPVWEITVCIIIGLVGQGLIRYGFCFTPIVFSAIIVMLPGYWMAIAMQELVSRHMLCGSVRIVYAIIYSFLLGYGVAMGAALYKTFDPSSKNATPAAVCAVDPGATLLPMGAESPWFQFLAVPLFGLGYCLYVKARPNRWIMMFIVAAVGYVVNYCLRAWTSAPQQVFQVVPAFVVGFAGHLLTRFTHRMSFDTVLLAIFYLVPSSLGVNAANGFFGGDGSGNAIGTQGAGFALAMIETSIGIMVGLFLATLIVYPRGTTHTPLMTF